MTWTDEAELLDLVNGTEFGLAAYVFAGDLQRAHPRSPRRSTPAWSASTAASSPTPSAPFGGVKQSGLGREGARDGPRGVPGDAVPQRRLAHTDRLIAVATGGESRLCRGARASGVADLEIAVDIRERYPFTFADRQATTRREPLKRR